MKRLAPVTYPNDLDVDNDRDYVSDVDADNDNDKLMLIGFLFSI